ncbi:hypothetical protein D3P96_07780 [Weissella viridescens]|uniref:Uncharacterized protein n=1 Tax=Weissella viridescens TaxID=1629 RepID=A0A3P2RAH0_WEIVI|nr:hypothetical protein [Weissella viridescens]RRG17444.1 hypothetical protein D3P96_07780 [Weissella viridescens]
MNKHNVDKHFKTTFQNKFVSKGRVGRCIREKHVSEIGDLLLVNFGVVSIWCFKRDLVEVGES